MRTMQITPDRLNDMVATNLELLSKLNNADIYHFFNDNLMQKLENHSTQKIKALEVYHSSKTIANPPQYPLNIIEYKRNIYALYETQKIIHLQMQKIRNDRVLLDDYGHIEDFLSSVFDGASSLNNVSGRHNVAVDHGIVGTMLGAGGAAGNASGSALGIPGLGVPLLALKAVLGLKGDISFKEFNKIFLYVIRNNKPDKFTLIETISRAAVFYYQEYKKINPLKNGKWNKTKRIFNNHDTERRHIYDFTAELIVNVAKKSKSSKINLTKEKHLVYLIKYAFYSFSQQYNLPYKDKLVVWGKNNDKENFAIWENIIQQNNNNKSLDKGKAPVHRFEPLSRNNG